jgi:hypothetical protein
MVSCEEEETRVLSEGYGRISRGQRDVEAGAQVRDATREICLTLKSQAKGGSGSKFIWAW